MEVAAVAGPPRAMEPRREVMLEPDEVAEAVVSGLREERFLILPHPEVEKYFQNKANDYDRWIGGMRKLQRTVFPGT